jgi:hypothetical protein
VKADTCFSSKVFQEWFPSPLDKGLQKPGKASTIAQSAACPIKAAAIDAQESVMKQSKWPDFLFTVVVRFVCGLVLGALGCLLIFWAGLLRVSAHNHYSFALIFIGLGAFVGAIAAVCTIPRWQTPWFKREPLHLDNLENFESTAGANVVPNSVSIKVTGRDGVEREYSSLGEVPPDLRAEVESLQSEAEKEKGLETTFVKTSRLDEPFAVNVVHQKNVSLYKIIDESGAEHIYHSLDEMPPEIRAAVLEEGQEQQNKG